LRYIITVRVTAAIKLPLLHTLSYARFGYNHWAGVASITSTYVFAKSYVFGKQSAFPILCSFPGLILVALLRYFAEFLKDYSSLTFVFSTCPLVSDWYSFLKSGFSRYFPSFLPIVPSLSGFLT